MGPKLRCVQLQRPPQLCFASFQGFYKLQHIDHTNHLKPSASINGYNDDTASFQSTHILSLHPQFFLLLFWASSCLHPRGN